MPNLIHLGSEVKMTDKNEVEGYLVLFGSPDEADFVGDYFTRNTDFDLNPDGTGQATMYFNHGLDPVLKSHKLNGGIKARLSIRDKGVWIEGKLDEANEYDAMVIELIKRRQSTGKSLGWSSGVPAHLVQREEVKSGINEIKAWSLGSDASLTHTPADYRNQATYKTIELLPIRDLSIEGDSSSTVKTGSVKTDGADGADDGSNLINQPSEVKKMSDNPTQTQPQEPPQTPPLAQPVTLEAVRAEVKASFDEFRKAFVGELPAPNGDPIVNAPPVITAKGVNIQPNPIGGGDDSEGIKAFWHYAKTGQGNSSLKALQEDTDSEGGYTVPNDFLGRIVEKRDELSVVRQVSNFFMIPTTLKTYDIPYESNSAAVMAVTAEESAYNESDPAFGNKQGVIQKHTRKIVVSEELLDDTQAALEAFLNSRVSREVAKTENSVLVTELEANGTESLTIDSNSAIAASEIPEIVGFQPEEWETGSIWLMRKSTENLIRSLQGNPYLFLPTPQGNMNQLWNYPVYRSGQVDAVGASASPIHFFNPEAIAVIDRLGLTMMRDPYSNGDNGQVIFRFKFRFDVVIVQAEAVHEIKMPA